MPTFMLSTATNEEFLSDRYTCWCKTIQSHQSYQIHVTHQAVKAQQHLAQIISHSHWLKTAVSFFFTLGLFLTKIQPLKISWLLTGAPKQRYWQYRETANVELDSSVGRAPARQSGGRRFKSRSSQFFFVHPTLSLKICFNYIWYRHIRKGIMK